MSIPAAVLRLDPFCSAGELSLELGSYFAVGTGIGLDFGRGGTTTKPAASGDDGSFSSGTGGANVGTGSGGVAKNG